MRMKKDNRGAALSMVIVIIAFVSVLVAAVLSVSMMNVYMKRVDRKAKENFYSAEGALEQINLGLQKKMSEAASDAYRVVMQNYAGDISEEARRLRFNQRYLQSLQAAVGLAGTGGVYDRTVLEGFLSDDIKAYVGVNANGEACDMQADADSVVLKNVVVSYTDPEGYLTYLKTDIRMAAPNLNLVHPLEMPDVFEYCIIANQKLSSNNNSVVTFGANVYAGADGMTLQEGTRWSFDGAQRLVVSGDISIPQTGLLAADGEMDLWTNEILVKGGELRINGRTYVANDLILSARGSEVDLNGEYYGYGNGVGLSDGPIVLAKEGESSAILINGTETTLDMSGIRRLLLAGSAQLRGDIVGEAEGINGSTIVNFGESIEVKSNQIAYLVPPECIGVSEGETLIGRNPMTAEEYAKLRQYETNLGTGFEEVSFTTVVEGLNKTLQEYKPDDRAGYRKVYVTDINGKQLIYYYVDFDTDQASQYFREYYVANKDKLDQFMKTYVDEIISSGRYIRLMTDGNMIFGSGSGTLELQSNVNNGAYLSEAEKNQLREESAGYQRRFRALGTKLMQEYEDLSATEKSRTVFDNIIRYSAVEGTADNAVFAGVPAATGLTYTADGEGNAAAIVINNINSTAYHYNSDPQNKICLILATGDVVLEQNFKGIVIARGSVTVADGVTAITGNTEKLRRILKTGMPDHPGQTILEYYFRDGDKYILDEGLGDALELHGDYISFGELISYEHWTKS